MRATDIFGRKPFLDARLQEMEKAMETMDELLAMED